MQALISFPVGIIVAEWPKDHECRYNRDDGRLSHTAFTLTSPAFRWTDNSLIFAFTRSTSSFVIRTRACDSTWTSWDSIWSVMSALDLVDRWVAVAPPDGSAVLSLVAPKPDSKQYGLIGRSTQVVFITDDVVAKFREWRKRGVRFLYTPRLKQITYERQPHAQIPLTTRSSTESTHRSGAACSRTSRISTEILLRW